MNFRRSLIVGTLLAAFSSTAGAQDEGIVVYNAQHEALTQAWADGFTAATGIRVTLRNGNDTELGNQIVLEGASSPADVFLTENSPAMVLVDNANLFEPLGDDVLTLVPEAFRPSNGHWVGIAARSTVFAYDKTKLTEADLPKSIMDLADPSWQGRWAASPSGADFQAIVSAMLSLKGEDATAAWLAGMKANVVPYRGNTAAMRGVNAGEIAGAVIYHYYYYGDQAKTGENSVNVGLHFFKNQDPGAFVSVSGGGVLASSTHKERALAFLKWVAGPEGQKILREGTSFEYAIGVGEAANPALPPLADLQAPSVDPASLNSQKVTDLMTSAGVI